MKSIVIKLTIIGLLAAVFLAFCPQGLSLVHQAFTPPPVPQPEVATAVNPFSTFSLNIADVSFRLAEASLNQGQMPDPGSIRSEEFINAFDYRDPENRSTPDRIPVVEKQLQGVVDNSACPAIEVKISMTLTTPAKAEKPVPVLMMFGGFGFGGGRGGFRGGGRR